MKQEAAPGLIRERAGSQRGDKEGEIWGRAGQEQAGCHCPSEGRGSPNALHTSHPKDGIGHSWGFWSMVGNPLGVEGGMDLSLAQLGSVPLATPAG